MRQKAERDGASRLSPSERVSIVGGPRKEVGSGVVLLRYIVRPLHERIVVRVALDISQSTRVG